MKNSMVILLGLIFSSLLVSAIPFPNSFYGNINFNGTPVKGACVITLKTIDATTTCTSLNGKYGYNPICIIEEENPSNKIVEFYVDNVKVTQHVFESYNQSEVNLSLNFLPVCGPACGDGTCNGGETCSSCPGDCGACSSSSSSSSSGGGGGGGGGGSSIKPVVNTNNTQNESIIMLGTENTEDLSVDAEDSSSTEPEDKTSNNFLGSGAITALIIVMVILLLIIISVVYSRREETNNKIQAEISKISKTKTGSEKKGTQVKPKTPKK